MTRQRAWGPQMLTHGSTHFWSTQALSTGHSELIIHSGLQFGALPMYVGKQEQTACRFISLHWLWGPQGLGMQGLIATAWVEAKIINNYY